MPPLVTPPQKPGFAGFFRGQDPWQDPCQDPCHTPGRRSVVGLTSRTVVTGRTCCVFFIFGVI